MEKSNYLTFLVLPLYIVLLMWVVYWIEIRWAFDFSKYGILPRDLKGLKGIFFGPFVHGSLKHLFNNSIPLLVLSSSLLFFYPKQAFQVLIIGTILSGIGTWIVGRYSYHIGASGVVYMLASYLLFQGLFSKSIQLISISLIVVFFYGSLIWYLFPIDPQVSWEGHSSGFLVGVVLSLFYYKKIPNDNKKYDWEKEDFELSNDFFMQHFDSKGNFHPTEHWYNSKPDGVTHTGEENQDVKYDYKVLKKFSNDGADELSHKE